MKWNYGGGDDFGQGNGGQIKLTTARPISKEGGFNFYLALLLQ